MSSPPTIAVLVRDLIFASRISATARAVGAEVMLLRDSSALESLSADRLIIDLDQPGTIDAAAQWKTRTAGQVIGFVSHVNADAIARAKEAGFDQVLRRSDFVQSLPQLLSPTP